MFTTIYKGREIYREEKEDRLVVFYLLSDGCVARLHVHDNEEDLSVLRPVEEFETHQQFRTICTVVASDMLELDPEVKFFTPSFPSFPVRARQIYAEQGKEGEKVTFYLLASGDVARLYVEDRYQKIEFLRATETLKTHHAPTLWGMINAANLLQRDNTITYF